MGNVDDDTKRDVRAIRRAVEISVALLGLLVLIGIGLLALS